ncbi:unnamed protein product [Musa acuminata subsp. malaccensis]|uniref:(wild Malaysian banana) hypothetical protein n=1 Tax=Musa acuminata subsp. malaccensis TaxID=214687 RepID=A0A804JXL7_MUSAM|nr:unnamed protein product [Musa acuminata subsp. malaccensis]
MCITSGGIISVSLEFSSRLCSFYFAQLFSFFFFFFCPISTGVVTRDNLFLYLPTVWLDLCFALRLSDDLLINFSSPLPIETLWWICRGHSSRYF